MKKILRNNKKTENMNRLRANNPARAPPADPICGTEETKIRKEIAIMKKCDHPNIIKFYSFIDDQASASICLIMEFMEGGELQWTIDDEPYLTMDQTRRCIRDVVLGLQYLHYQGIIHRDIKPSNIMWTADRSHVKIGDFGIAHLADPDSELNNAEGLRHAGTPAFLAPEIAPGGDAPMGAVTPAVDLWALGVTLFCMLFGRKPFAAHPAAASQIAAEASLYRAIREDSWTPRTTLCAQRRPIEPPDWAAGGVLHLLTHLLCKDPAKRFGITDVKASAWLLEGVQRRAEWIAGTTPRIVVSAADEANAIQVPRFKWNFGASLGRRFGKLFRTARDPTNSDGTGAVRSEPTVRLRSSSRKVEKAKGKGKERVDGDGPGLTRKNTKEEKKQQKQKSRSVDALTTNTGAPKPRRSETAPGPVPPLSPSTTGSMSATSDRPRTRGFLRWPARLTAGRHSTEALGSASMAGPLLNAEQRTRSVVTRGGGSMGIDGVKDGEGSGAVEMGMHMGMGLGGAFNLDGGEVMGRRRG
ncbi:kinase-like domain-containing protein [Mycena crocata]|nr:kinase-like domain-containing protein [Mycena crocata]